MKRNKSKKKSRSKIFDWKKPWQAQGDCNGEDSENREEATPKNRRQGQALSLRPMPKAKPETGKSPSALVLRDMC